MLKFITRLSLLNFVPFQRSQLFVCNSCWNVTDILLFYYFLNTFSAYLHSTLAVFAFQSCLYLTCVYIPKTFLSDRAFPTPYQCPVLFFVPILIRTPCEVAVLSKLSKLFKINNVTSAQCPPLGVSPSCGCFSYFCHMI